MDKLFSYLFEKHKIVDLDDNPPLEKISTLDAMFRI